MDVFENAPEQALAWHDAGRGAVLATVVETWGSAPRRMGAQLVIAGDGEMQGSVSGGCVEGAVVLEATDALEAGEQRLLEYGVSDGDAFAVGLACGGTIRILVEPVGDVLPAEVLRDLTASRAAREPVAYEVNLTTGARQLVREGYADRFAMDRSGFEAEGALFIGIHNPPLRLVIVGAVHIAQALVPMARIAGYDPYIVDPRAAFGSEARFPGERIVSEWPDEALEEIGVDSRTAVVLLTHDPKLDDPALLIALRSRAFYIGALGSKRTHAARLNRLEEAGMTPKALERIHGPIGLDIGASGPPEIAVAILSEMTRVLRRGS
ncbi:XdhC family protein [uncultured Roseobacter sp.]|uniref:XdhC family protein n=1 Tax=uncultured Roseobacter sp. TaxID=114847 RepID=UPI002622DA6F|nr:XdhC family protein [uncultured Roseobacter sp.]